MSKPSVKLIVPGILDSLTSSQDPAVFTCLQRLLKRSDSLQSDVSGYHATIADYFESGDLDKQMLPVAAVSCFAETGQKNTDTKMHITPVHIQADKDRLILQGSYVLSLESHERQHLLHELNETYQQDGFVFESHENPNAYVSLPEQPDCLFHPLEDVLGRSVEPFLPAGKDQLFWHRFLNEVQMLFHASAVNQSRLENNRIPVNSVWCWGCGRLPGTVSTQLSGVFSDNLFATGLAKLAAIKTEVLSDHADGLLEQVSEGDWLVVFDLDERDILSVEPEHHQQRLSQLEAHWLSPLLTALKQGDLASVSLSDTNGKSFFLKKSHLRRFWRH